MCPGAPALIPPETRETRRRAQLPGARLLRAGDFQCAFEAGLRFDRVALARPQGDFAGNAIELSFVPPLMRCFHYGRRFANADPGVVEMTDFCIGQRQM